MISVAVIGLGVIGKEFLSALSKSDAAQLVAVCDLSPAKVNELATPEVRPFSSHQELIAANCCQAAIVALPNDQHFEVVGDLLRAGIHVCCEKPLTVDSQEAHFLDTLAKERQTVLRTAFHRRFNANLLELRERVRNHPSPVQSLMVRYHEDIREHTGGESWYLDKDRCGGGCLVDNGPNALDMARVLVGEMTLQSAEFGDVRRSLEHYALLELVNETGVTATVELDWSYPYGELKDVSVVFADGTTDRADMLQGFPGFKSSLTHEYEGILDDFVKSIEGEADAHSQTHIVDLVAEARVAARQRHTRLRMVSKHDVPARVVRVLFHETEKRGMILAHQGSACFRRGEVHELVVTTDATDLAGATIDRVGYLCFIEFESAAMLTRGDTVWFGDTLLGEFAGFDESHMPNHLNLILHHDTIITGEDIDLVPGSSIRIKEGRQREFLSSRDPGAWNNQQSSVTTR